MILLSTPSIKDFTLSQQALFNILCDCALYDPFQRKWDSHKIPRQAAIQKIIEFFLHKPETFLLLKNRAVDDCDEQVRYEAIEGLAKIPDQFLDSESFFNFFRERVQNETFQRERNLQLNPRLAALDVLVTGYFNDPRTTELLRDRAINDPDPQLREWAKQQLVTQGQITES